MSEPVLNPQKARLFRIVHVDCVPWILDHGIHCRSSATQDPNYINIGNPELIDKRSRRVVPVPPGGVLSDYVPFYFTPRSIMMYNIHTGHQGIVRRENREIAILVTSVERVLATGATFRFTNQHAYPPETEFFSDRAQLDRIDWRILNARLFRKDDSDPGRALRYQAEGLVHRHVPVSALIGIACYDDAITAKLQGEVKKRGLELAVKTTPHLYF